MKSTITQWVFFLLFIIIGVLNLLLVHPVPGLFYLVLSLLYAPGTDSFMRAKIGFVIPLWLKVLVALVVLWGTLAVGDLADILGL